MGSGIFHRILQYSRASRFKAIDAVWKSRHLGSVSWNLSHGIRRLEPATWLSVLRKAKTERKRKKEGEPQ